MVLLLIRLFSYYFTLSERLWLYLVQLNGELDREDGFGSGLDPVLVHFSRSYGHGGPDWVISEVKIKIDQNQKTD